MATKNEDIKNLKIDEQHKFSLDADLMDFTETEVVEVRFYGMVNEHIASEMIQTQNSYFFVSLKTTKNERKERS